ncbi:MAG: NUDIX domain-containing protein [bacterium]
MKNTDDVVTVFLENEGKILLVKRSKKASTYSGRWAGISGYKENAAEEQARIETGEETGLNRNDFQLIQEGKAFLVEDPPNGKHWKIHPFRFKLLNEKSIELNWENSDYRWVQPQKITEFNTVPNLKEAWEKVNE